MSQGPLSPCFSNSPTLGQAQTPSPTRPQFAEGVLTPSADRVAGVRSIRLLPPRRQAPAFPDVFPESNVRDTPNEPAKVLPQAVKNCLDCRNGGDQFAKQEASIAQGHEGTNIMEGDHNLLTSNPLGEFNVLTNVLANIKMKNAGIDLSNFAQPTSLCFKGESGATQFRTHVLDPRFNPKAVEALHIVVNANDWSMQQDEAFAMALRYFSGTRGNHGLQELRISVVGNTLFTKNTYIMSASTLESEKSKHEANSEKKDLEKFNTWKKIFSGTALRKDFAQHPPIIFKSVKAIVKSLLLIKDVPIVEVHGAVEFNLKNEILSTCTAPPPKPIQQSTGKKNNKRRNAFGYGKKKAKKARTTTETAEPANATCVGIPAINTVPASNTAPAADNSRLHAVLTEINKIATKAVEDIASTSKIHGLDEDMFRLLELANICSLQVYLPNPHTSDVLDPEATEDENTPSSGALMRKDSAVANPTILAQPTSFSVQSNEILKFAPGSSSKWTMKTVVAPKGAFSNPYGRRRDNGRTRLTLLEQFFENPLEDMMLDNAKFGPFKIGTTEEMVRISKHRCEISPRRGRKPEYYHDSAIKSGYTGDCVLGWKVLYVPDHGWTVGREDELDGGSRWFLTH
jgi:hypothetical protein